MVSGNDELTIDARQGKPVGFVLDKPTARAGLALVLFLGDTTWGGEDTASTGWQMNDFDGFLVRPSTTASAPTDFDYQAEAGMGEPDGAGGFSTSGYIYNVRRIVPGKVPTDLVTRVRDSELAKVRSHHSATKPGTFGARDNFLVRPLPFSLNEFYTPGQPWYGIFDEMNHPDDGRGFSHFATMPRRSFRLGQTTTERWNEAVFGPAFPKNPSRPWRYAGRLGNEVAISIPLSTEGTSGREGYAESTGNTTLFRDGEQIGSEENVGFGRFRVPAGTSTYRLHGGDPGQPAVVDDQRGLDVHLGHGRR